MIGCTTQRLDQLMRLPAQPISEPDRVFLYAPMNFAASWMLMLSAFSREAELTLSTDLTRLADEIRLAASHYFLNVPTLLERVKRGVEEISPNRLRRFAHYTREPAKPGSASTLAAAKRLTRSGCYLGGN